MRSSTILIAAALASLVTSTALAQPTAFAERSKIVATGTQIHLYGLPTRSSSGTIKYFDVTVDLLIGGAGKPNLRGTVTSTQPPDVTPTDFAAGTYTGAGITCVLQTAPFSGGRTEVLLNCSKDATPTNTAGVTWYTGAIADNPFAIDLLDEELEIVPGNDQFAWGQVTTVVGPGGLGGCLSLGDQLSARQIGDTLFLIDYGSVGNSPDCGLNLFKSPL